MKSLTQLRQTLQEKVEPIDKLEEETEKVSECHFEESHAWSMPMVLILRRKTIRNFSDGTQVALYYNEKLDRYFSIPVRETVDKDPIGVSEDVTTVMDQLYYLSEGYQGPLTLDNGDTLNLDAAGAKTILTVHESLTEENQQTFVRFLSESGDKFQKMLTFSLSQI